MAHTNNTHLTTAELFYGIPSMETLVFWWVVKSGIGIILACGIPSILLALIPMDHLQTVNITLNGLGIYLVFLMAGVFSYYRMKDTHNNK